MGSFLVLSGSMLHFMEEKMFFQSWLCRLTKMFCFISQPSTNYNPRTWRKLHASLSMFPCKIHKDFKYQIKRHGNSSRARLIPKWGTYVHILKWSCYMDILCLRSYTEKTTPKENSSLKFHSFFWWGLIMLGRNPLLYQCFVVPGTCWEKRNGQAFDIVSPHRHKEASCVYWYMHIRIRLGGVPHANPDCPRKNDCGVSWWDSLHEQIWTEMGDSPWPGCKMEDIPCWRLLPPGCFFPDRITQEGSELASYLVHLDPSFATGWNAATGKQNLALPHVLKWIVYLMFHGFDVVNKGSKNFPSKFTSTTIPMFLGF